MQDRITACRSCENSELEIFLDLGKKPPSDRILTDEMLKQPEPFYPLEVAFCPQCSLVQILDRALPRKCNGFDSVAKAQSQKLGD
jgi:hypothetical protein